MTDINTVKQNIANLIIDNNKHQLTPSRVRSSFNYLADVIFGDTNTAYSQIQQLYTTMTNLWEQITEYTAVISVAGRTGEVVLAVADITDAGSLALQDATDVTVTDIEINGTISKFKNNVKVVAGTTYTLLAEDSGSFIRFTSATAVTVTMPNNMPIGYNLIGIQSAAGVVTFTAASGATLQSRSSHSKTAGQHAVVSLIVITNADNASATYVFAGDTAA